MGAWGGGFNYELLFTKLLGHFFVVEAVFVEDAADVSGELVGDFFLGGGLVALVGEVFVDVGFDGVAGGLVGGPEAFAVLVDDFDECLGVALGDGLAAGEGGVEGGDVDIDDDVGGGGLGDVGDAELGEGGVAAHGGEAVLGDEVGGGLVFEEVVVDGVAEGGGVGGGELDGGGRIDKDEDAGIFGESVERGLVAVAFEEVEGLAAGEEEGDEGKTNDE